MQLSGKIKKKEETKTYGSNGFRKREFVITTNEQYPQDIKLEMIQDNCSLLDHFEVGDNVDCKINIRGKEYTNKNTGEVGYFNSIQVWKIGKVAENAQVAQDEASPF